MSAVSSIHIEPQMRTLEVTFHDGEEVFRRYAKGSPVDTTIRLLAQLLKSDHDSANYSGEPRK